MTKRVARLVGIILLFVLMSSASALAIFINNVSVTQSSLGSATLQPPTALVASGGCQVLILGPKMTLTWAATVSTFASGYIIYRSITNGGPYTFLANVSGRTTTTYTDTTVTGLNTTYYYVMRSIFQNWNSVDSLQASGKTPLLCL